VRLLDGMVRYRDERAGTGYEIGALNIDAAAEAAAGTVTMDGAFVWQGQPFHFSATVDAGRTGEGQLEQVALKLAGGPVEVAYGGTLSWRGGIAAEGVLTLQRLAYKDLKIGPATFDVKADAGVLELVLREAELYGGRGQGVLTIDTNGPTPVIAARLKLADVSVLALLKDTASVGWLDGRGSLALDLGAQGFSERQFVETLQGQVQVNVAEGSVTGLDIDRSLRALQRGRLGSVAARREGRTAFRSLAATFEIANGIARTQDLKLDSAHVEVSGEGRIELGPRRIDCTLHTKIPGGQAEEGAAIKIGTIELPIAISGPLERPKFAISGQEGLSDAINQIGKNLRSREVQDALKGLLGGDGEKRVKPGELIEKLLKRD
jgi:AsmA protein